MSDHLKSSSSLKEIQKILGLVTCHSDVPEEVTITPPQKSPIKKGEYLIPEDFWLFGWVRKG